MIILGIDPGPEQSAWLIWDYPNESIIDMDMCDSEYLIFEALIKPKKLNNIIAVEHMQCMGQLAGKSIFETCYWIGELRYANNIHWGCKWFPVYRKDIKMHFCETNKAKDKNIRQALIDRFGEPGTKKKPGKLYGVKKDLWSALAIAVYAADTLLTPYSIWKP